MGLLDMASGASAWRGYEYFVQGDRVSDLRQTDDGVYDALVRGNAEAPYRVHIDTDHPRKSSCDCPHAAGTRIICKHMIATLFTAFPDMAREYKEEVDRWEREEEAREQERYRELAHYVNSLTKAELREELMNALLELDELDRYRYRW